MARALIEREPVDAVTEEWRAFTAWLDARQHQEIEPGITYRQLLRAMGGPLQAALWADFQTLVSPPAAAEPPAELSPVSDEYESWSESKRRAANLNALKALRRSGINATVDERAHLMSFTGWGGVDLSRVPRDPKLLGNTRPTVNDLPLSLCRALWALARRLSAFPIERVLDPAAGMARFAQATPDDVGVDWTLVEPEPLLYELLEAIYPNADVEQNIGEVEGKFDLSFVYAPVARNDEAPALRDALQFLQPGGVLLALVPSVDWANASTLHAWVASEAHYFGGVYVANADLTLVAWMKRAVPSTKAAPELAEPSLTHDYAAIVNAPMAPVPLVTMNEIRSWRKGVSPVVDGATEDPSVAAAVALSAKADDDLKWAANAFTSMEDPALAESIFLAYRVGRFQALLGKGPEGRARAESGRQELLADVGSYVARYGNPHKRVELRGRKSTAPLLAAVSTRGTVAALITQPAAAFGFDSPPNTTNVVEIVVWYSHARGVCTVEDVAQHVDVDQDTLVDTMVGEANIAVEGLTDDKPRFYHVDDYVTGDDLYAKMAAVDRALAGVDLALVLREKLDVQKRALLSATAPLTLSRILVNPRSGFVPLACVQEYVNAYLTSNAAWKVGNPANITLRLEQGLLKAATNGSLVMDPQHEWLRFFLGYYNHQLSVVDPDEKEAREFDVFETKDLEERMKKVERLESDFKMWLSSHDHWRDEVETAYNRVFRGRALRVHSGGELGLCRMYGSPITLGGHQNSAARRFVEEYGGISALDVGGGKTMLSLAVLAKARQDGKARQALVVVPPQVLFQWRKTVRKLLPDYRVGIVGFSFKGGRKTKDDAAIRKAKWLRFAEGGYDLLICPYQNFMDDIELNDASTLQILADQTWLVRQVGLEDEGKRLLARRVVAARDELADAEQELGYTSSWDDRKIASLTKKVERLRESIDRWTRASVRESTALIRQVESDITGATQNKPFRPKVKPPREWQSAWKKEELLAFAESQGLQVNADGSIDRASALQLVDGDVSALKDCPFEGRISRGTVPKARIIEILQFFWPPTVGGAQPREALVAFEDLNVDYLVVDEAHNFKNVWYPICRYGVDRISYMGSCGLRIGTRTWDMYLKAQYTNRRFGGGVLLLTATPIKNSPIELFNMIALARAKEWSSYRVRHAEEFIDRYCALSREVTVKVDRSVDIALAMSAFSGLDEMRDVMARVVDRKTIDDLLALGVLKSVPQPHEERVIVPLDAHQAFIYTAIAEEIREELKRAQTGGDGGMSSSLILLRMDMLSKAALDPRLLAGDVAELRMLLADHGLVVDPLRDASLPTRQVTYQKWQSSGSRRGEKEPAKPLDNDTLLFLVKRYELLMRLGIEKIRDTYASEGLILPKYAEVAHFIQKNSACGHIIFCFAGETEIITAGGVRPIGPLVGTQQTILTRDGSWVEAPIGSGGVQRLYKLTLSRNGVEKTIYTTANHRWFAKASRSGPYLEYSTLELQAKQQCGSYFKGHRLQQVYGRSYKNRVNASPFGVAHGFVVGDGTSPRNERHSASADLHGAKDAALIPYFAMCPRTDHPDVDMVRFVALPNFFKELPSIHENSGYLLGWLMGYFAADGTIMCNGQVRITSVDRENIEFVRDVCVVLGIGVYDIASDTRPASFDPTQMITAYRLEFQRRTLDASFFLIEEHRRRFIEHGADDLKERDWWVKSVEPTDRFEETFCATVEGHRSFTLAGNIVTGNSDYNDTHEHVRDAIVAIVGADRIPPERVAILTGDLDAEERQRISELFNGREREVDPDTGRVIEEALEPAYDVIIGNSAVMAEGIDLQRRTCAIHHLNFPWEPATLTQRNGRGVRQGNTLEAVVIRYYVAERSFDGFKFDMVWAKGDWQKTLFTPGVRSMDNPAAGSGMSREEALITLTADNPEEAAKLWAQVKVQKEAVLRERARKEARSAFVELTENYAAARRASDPATKHAMYAQGDVVAERARAMSDEAFADKSVIGLARDYVVYYDFDSGLSFREGERICVRSADPEDWQLHTQPRRLEITKIHPSGSFFLSREFGTAAVRQSMVPLDLLGSRSASGPVEKLDINDYGGWDETEDTENILGSITSTSQLPMLTKEMLGRLGDRVWPNIFRSVNYRARPLVDHQEIGFAPLFKRSDPSDILLLPFQTAQWSIDNGMKNELRSIVVDEYTLLLPWTSDGWSRLTEAIKRDKIRVLGVSSYTLTPVHLDAVQRSQELRALARTWFGKLEGISPKLIAEMDRRRARVLAQEAADTDTGAEEVS